MPRNLTKHPEPPVKCRYYNFQEPGAFKPVARQGMKLLRRVGRLTKRFENPMRFKKMRDREISTLFRLRKKAGIKVETP